jgi:hypothetical protein
MALRPLALLRFDPWFEPALRDLALRRINLTYGRRVMGDCTLIPLSAARAREAGPFFASAFESQAIHRPPTRIGRG